MSTRIMRAPVRPSQATQANAEGTADSKASTAASSSAKSANAAPAQSSSNLLQAGFETHSGKDMLLNEANEAGPQRHTRTGMRRELANLKRSGNAGQAAGQTAEAGKKGEGKGLTKGKRALALLAGGEALLPQKGEKASSKTLGKLKKDSLKKAKTTTRTDSKTVKAKGNKGKAHAKETSKSATANKTQSTSQQKAAQKGAAATGKPSTTLGKSSTSLGQGGKASPSQMAQQGKAGIQRSVSQALAMQPGGTAAQGKTGLAQGAQGTSMGGMGQGATATGLAGKASAGTATVGADGASSMNQAEPGAKLGQGLQRSLGSQSLEGSTFREQMKGMQGKAAAQFQATMGKSSGSSRPLSLHSLLVQEAKGSEAKEVRRKSEASPKQELRQLVQQWANAKEANFLMNMQATVMPNDVAAVAWRIATLAAQGAIPQGQLMALISKTLKSPGKRKQIKRIKDLLVKKGSVPAGISTETLELIAAMIALYLAKQGNIDADDLIEELFGMPSRGIDIIVPDGGGSHHDEGREEQRHQEHREGQRLGDSDI
ncbi:MAG: hypothetical protein EP343_11070 [Deltaproteobacteria bacterium]|nr:MAG: hypothetical protein EP343_11070 [Deltaproteobacteria bacterium]